MRKLLLTLILFVTTAVADCPVGCIAITLPDVYDCLVVDGGYTICTLKSICIPIDVILSIIP